MDKNRRAQMEAFGLAIIVILITLGFFIFVSLKSKMPKNDPIKNYIPDEMASNFVHSIVSVNVEECYGSRLKLSDLIKHCAKGENVSDLCSGIDTCQLVNQTIMTMLNKTLIEQNFAFRLSTENLRWPNGGELEIINRNCTVGKETAKRGYVAIKLYSSVEGTYGDTLLNLDICKCSTVTC